MVELVKQLAKAIPWLIFALIMSRWFRGYGKLHQTAMFIGWGAFAIVLFCVLTDYFQMLGHRRPPADEHLPDNTPDVAGDQGPSSDE